MEFTTLVHEYAHQLLHRSDDRPASRDYILLYRGDREALSSSLDHIQRAASVILKAISVGG